MHPLAPAAETEAARRLTLAKSLPPAALEALDDITRPMTAREVERALYGLVSRSAAKALANALRPYAIVIIDQRKEPTNAERPDPTASRSIRYRPGRHT